MFSSDLSIELFLILKQIFTDLNGNSKMFSLREKRNTQDDPLDEFIASEVAKMSNKIECIKSPGPLISPDFVFYRNSECKKIPLEQLKNSPSKIIAIEVKKLERSKTGKIARETGLDYNTTPPCGTVRFFDEDNNPVDVKGFYLFICLESKNDKFFVSALTLCDGDVLNEDFSLYLRITGKREKQLHLGTYSDGIDRMRPMLIFSNPLGVPFLDHKFTLITKHNLSDTDQRINLLGKILRSFDSTKTNLFHVFGTENSTNEIVELKDPFPIPKNRVVETQSRGKFRINFS
jgi:hypothetical protein